jgi:hypothetical protein
MPMITMTNEELDEREAFLTSQALPQTVHASSPCR